MLIVCELRTPNVQETGIEIRIVVIQKDMPVKPGFKAFHGNVFR
jgi:hypothetical protein